MLCLGGVRLVTGLPIGVLLAGEITLFGRCFCWFLVFWRIFSFCLLDGFFGFFGVLCGGHCSSLFALIKWRVALFSLHMCSSKYCRSLSTVLFPCWFKISRRSSSESTHAISSKFSEPSAVSAIVLVIVALKNLAQLVLRLFAKSLFG